MTVLIVRLRDFLFNMPGPWAMALGNIYTIHNMTVIGDLQQTQIFNIEL